MKKISEFRVKNGISRALGGSSVNPASRWRTVFISLVLALAIGSIGQTAPAQAAPAPLPVKIYLDIVNPKTTICVGETVSYEARVYAPPTTISGIELRPYAFSGMKVEALSLDPTVGDFVGPRRRTTGNTEDLVSLSNPNAEPGPHSAYFNFKGKKAGKTTLIFEGLAFGEYITFKVPVKVINCKYEVYMYSHWFITQGTGGSIDLVAMIKKAILTVDSEGGYSGSTDALWVPAITIPRACEHTDEVPPSAVTLTGSPSESGEQLILKLVFDSAALTETGVCVAGPVASEINTTNAMTPETLILTVPSAGGTWRAPQVLENPAGNVSSLVTVIVIPVEK